jgi:hypothetical protein
MRWYFFVYIFFFFFEMKAKNNIIEKFNNSLLSNGEVLTLKVVHGNHSLNLSRHAFLKKINAKLFSSVPFPFQQKNVNK